MALKVLLVEDDRTMRETIQYILEEHGYQVTSAENGLEGLGKAHADPPDLILLDLMMSEMDGFELAGELRQRKQLADIPIVVLSAYGVKDEIIGLLNAVGFVRKPVTAEKLTHELDRIRAELGLAADR